MDQLNTVFSKMYANLSLPELHKLKRKQLARSGKQHNQHLLSLFDRLIRHKYFQQRSISKHSN